MGPTGSGKSTLLNLIAGLDAPTTGKLTVAGANVGQMSEGERAKWRAANIGFVFQTYNLMPVLTARRERRAAAAAGQAAGEPSAASAREIALEVVGLEGPHGPLPAPAVRRSGAARDDRARDRHRSEDHRRRRADR